MTLLAPTMQAFFTDRLIGQLYASQQTITSYRDTFGLLLGYVQRETSRQPVRLQLEDLDARRVGAFLTYLETERENTAATRNTRLAAVHSLFKFAALRHPEHAELIQRVLAIPPKRTARTLLTFLTDDEINAMLASPDRSQRTGRRDHALMLLAIQTGIRVSELTGLLRRDISLDRTAPHIRVSGKGRKERITPLTAQTAAVLRDWVAENPGQPTDPLFTTNRGGALSRDAVERLLTKHASRAQATCPTLRTKRISPHVLRHTSAMQLLHAGVDTTVIALWLGHETTRTTQIYLHADLALKERALERTTPPHVQTGRYQAPDTLLEFLNKL
jgi:site-specific recombinase XerD